MTAYDAGSYGWIHGTHPERRVHRHRFRLTLLICRMLFGG
jgi:hypothetical protein